MRNTQPTFCLLLAFMAGTLALASGQRGGDESPKPEEFLGTWSGTWDGAGAGGGFELTLQQEQEKDAPLTGKVAVTGEPEYKATLKALTFDGRKMKARYDFPADQQAEVLLTATFKDNKATGTWTLRVKADETEVASGTWSVTRKPEPRLRPASTRRSDATAGTRRASSS